MVRHFNFVCALYVQTRMDGHQLASVTAQLASFFLFEFRQPLACVDLCTYAGRLRDCRAPQRLCTCATVCRPVPPRLLMTAERLYFKFIPIDTCFKLTTCHWHGCLGPRAVDKSGGQIFKFGARGLRAVGPASSFVLAQNC